MVDAYILESEKANYPRVIVSKDVYDLGIEQHAHHHLKQHEQEALNEVMTKDDDGYLYIDYFGKNIQNLDAPEFDFHTYAEQLNEIIQVGLSHQSSKVRDKFEWAKAKYNAMINSWKTKYAYLLIC